MRAPGWRRFGTTAIGIVALLVVAACSPAVPPTPAPTPSQAPSPAPAATGVVPTPVGSGGAPAEEVRVSLGIYSGRPDPEWTLTADEVAKLDAAVVALPAATGTAPVGGLGYHGFTVTRPGETFVAYLGTVAPPGDAPGPFKLDEGRLVERFLLETGRAHLAPAEITEVERALQE